MKDCKKFWGWMEKNKYGISNGYKNTYMLSPDCGYVEHTKQMLIGYMIEYLAVNGYFIGMANGDTRKGESFETIKSYYDRLLGKIKEMEK